MYKILLFPEKHVILIKKESVDKMKKVKLFFICMYIYIIIPVPCLIMAHEEIDLAGVLLYLWIALAIMIPILGIISMFAVAGMYNRGEYDDIRKSLKLLKLWTIPFYIINFVESFLMMFILTMATMGALLFLAIIPIFYTCFLILLTGCCGCCYLMYLRKQTGGENDFSGKRPSWIHFVLQLISVLDIIDTIYLLKISKKKQAK